MEFHKIIIYIILKLKNYNFIKLIRNYITIIINIEKICFNCTQGEKICDFTKILRLVIKLIYFKLIL